MEIEARTMARARLALGQAVSSFLYDPNVSLIDFGNPEHDGYLAEDELAIRIHTHQKLSGLALEFAVESGYTRPIPPTIGGFPTDVVEGTYKPHQFFARNRLMEGLNPRARRCDPLRGGISISNERQVNYGTLGGLAVDRRTGKEGFISNWHVLVGAWSARPGQRIYQPGRLDGGTAFGAIGALERDAMKFNLDAAFATLAQGRLLLNDQIQLGPVRGIGKAMPGMVVVKSGRRTGITYGRVTGVAGTARLRYDSLERLIGQVITIEPLEPGQIVSGPGDSGSLILDADSMQVVGLHFAGSDFPERGLSMDIQAVQNALEADLVTTVQAARAAFRAPRPSMVRA